MIWCLGDVYMIVNLFAILVAAIASMLIGMWYYSSLGFGKQWMNLLGWNKNKIDEEQKKGMGKPMIVAFLAQLLIALVLKMFMKAFPQGIIWALVASIIAWAGFVLTTSVSDVIWEGRKPGLWVLHNAYRLIAFIVMGFILGIWV